MFRLAIGVERGAFAVGASLLASAALHWSVLELAPAKGSKTLRSEPSVGTIELEPPTTDEQAAAATQRPALPVVAPARISQQRAASTRDPAAFERDATQEKAPLGVEAPAAHFTMTLGNQGQVSRVDARGNQGVGGSAPGETVEAESSVSVPARLVSVAPVVYPPAARTEEIEADVPVEIVIDAKGNVVEAAVVRSAGYGLDEAARVAVLRYRFSPAQKNGQLVRVRMRWTVQFRLN